jgi:hypothetical protein
LAAHGVSSSFVLSALENEGRAYAQTTTAADPPVQFRERLDVAALLE